MAITSNTPIVESSSSSSSSSSNNCLQQLFFKLFQQRQSEADTSSSSSYLLLLEHSQSFALRQQQCNNTSDDLKNQADDDDDDSYYYYYRLAGMKTPSELARRNWLACDLFLNYMLTDEKCCSGAAASSSSSSSNYRVLSIQTLPKGGRKRQTTEFNNCDHFEVIDCGSANPFGWDDDNNDDDDGVNLENLSRLLQVIKAKIQKQQQQQQKHTVIVLDSLAPFICRHGFVQTIRFVQALKSATSTLFIVPMITEMLTAPQIRQLQDMANAVLIIADEDVILMRQGVREKSNAVREQISFDIILQQQQQQQSAQIVDCKNNAMKPMLKIHTTTSKGKGNEKVSPSDAQHPSIDDINNATDSNIAKQNDSITTTAAAAAAAASGRKSGKIQLQIEEESKTTATATTTEKATPRFYLQEDDPEFEDYDEEDPDDDLDL